MFCISLYPELSTVTFISDGLGANSEPPYNISKGNHTSCSPPYGYTCVCTCTQGFGCMHTAK